MGMLKRGARFLLSSRRLSTDWWGVAILASAYLYRVEAGYATRPNIEFGTRIMINLDPVPRDAFLSRAMPGMVFGPAESVPGGYWVYQAGKIMSKVNVVVEGLTEEEMKVAKATFGESEHPLLPLDPPDGSMHDPTLVVFHRSVDPVSVGSASCPACVLQNQGRPFNVPHTLRWGECSRARPPPQPMQNLLPQVEDAELAAEDDNPEERPNPVLIRPSEVLENLGLHPDTLSSACVAKASKIKTEKDKNRKDREAVGILLQHPHAALATSEVSSISWLGSSGNSVPPCQHGSDSATSILSDVGTQIESTEDIPPLVEDSDDEIETHVISNAADDTEAGDTDSECDFDLTESSLFRLFRNPTGPKRRMQKKVRNRIKKLHREINQSDSVTKASFCRAAAVLLGSDGEYADLPDTTVHGLALESEMLLEPDSRTVNNAEVRGSTGVEAQGWRDSMETEFHKNFVERNVFSVSTSQERASYGPPLPMKLVFTRKKGLFKCRAVVCGNFERNPCEQSWTAQAEVSSLFAAVRLAIANDWVIGAVDVSGAFMYAPLPEHMLVVVQPPKFFVEAGLAKAGETWTLSRAVYGLKISPKAWGTCRDKELRQLQWKVLAESFELVQCVTDTQVWKICRKGSTELLGLMVVYVDDFLILCPGGKMRESLITALKTIWTLRPEAVLSPESNLTFLGLEFTHKPGGVYISQRKFIDIFLAQNGFKPDCGSSIETISMEAPGDVDVPTADNLRKLQGFAGEFNWLATRSRKDLAYFVSLLGSALSKYSAWSSVLTKKILRYLQGTRDAGIFLPKAGDLTSLIAWSDAGFAGISTKSQTGMILLWGGAMLLWRSGRQTVPALSTAEAELIACSMTWAVMAGIRILLEEWDIKFRILTIQVDNTAALTIAADGGNWRTRYFAVRGARVNHEIQCGTLKLEHCPTLKMLADGLTKLGTKAMMENVRNTMQGIHLV